MLYRLLSSRILFSKYNSFSSQIVKIAIGIISISFAIMLISTAVMRGFKGGISNKMYSFWGHILIQDAKARGSFTLEPIKLRDGMIDSLKSTKIFKVQKATLSSSTDKNGLVGLQSKSGIKSIYSTVLYPVIIDRKSEFEGIFAKGINQDFDIEFFENFLKQGKSSALWRKDNDFTIISSTTANRLNIKLGDKLIFHLFSQGIHHKKRLTVGGIYSSGLGEYDGKICFVNQLLLQSLLGWNSDEVSSYEVMVDRQEDINIIRDFIYLEKLSSNYYAQTIRDRFPEIFDWLDIQKVTESLIMGMMVIVTIINLITTILIFVLDRSKMIGLLKSFGMTDFNLRILIMYCAGYILFYSILIGNAFAFILCLLQQHFGWLKLDEENYYLDKVPIEIHLPTWLLINLFGFVIVLFTAILPSYIISRIQPVKVLHFK